MRACVGDCDDTCATVRPGAPQLCDGLQNDRSAPGWPAVLANEVDNDGDGYVECAAWLGTGGVAGGDCDDADPATHPGAPETNDGRDDQCPGDRGYGARDEISETCGFLTPGDRSIFSWPAQAGATSYDVACSPYADFRSGCTRITTTASFVAVPETPPQRGIFYYLVRAAAPNPGSFGQRSSGVERTVCPGCERTGDWCDDASVGLACVGAPISCDDGNPCTSGDACASGVCAGTFAPAADHLVISQIQVSGNGGPPDEFIEIYNPTAVTVSLGGWSSQSLASTFPWSVDVLVLANTIPPHGWYLVAPPGYNRSVPRDQTNTAFSLSTTGGSVFLVASTSPVGSCDAATIADRVAYGIGSCPEGAAPAAPASESSILRRPGGICGNGTDTGSNVTDFAAQAPSTPRNRTSPPQP